MAKLRELDIVDWQDSPPPIVTQNGARRQVVPPTLIGILGTLLLHALLIQSISFASRGAKPKSPETEESAVLISLPADANAREVASIDMVASLPDLSKMKIHSPKNLDPPALPNLETLALSEDQSSSATANAGDGAELSRLFGIYTGQIQARIDRVWRRPRTPVNENRSSAEYGESFQCEAQIVQDLHGNVQEILFPRCNGSPAWQQSLVVAIRQASPLPAPPSVKVFTQSITLRFIGLPYVQGASSEEYEIVARADQ